METTLIPSGATAAALFAADVFSTDAKGEPQATAVSFVGALDWLVGEGVSAVNISLAGDDNDLVALAVEKAAAKGVALVASAGNGGRDAAPAYPAALDEVIAVTAVDADARRYPEANLGDYIDLAAPGVRIPAGGAPDGYATGTSFAAPFVTAVAATLAANLPADAEALDEALAAHSRDLGAPGRDPEFGWGLVQAPKVCGE
jgi:subtilisin family serine protease